MEIESIVTLLIAVLGIVAAVINKGNSSKEKKKNKQKTAPPSEVLEKTNISKSLADAREKLTAITQELLEDFEEEEMEIQPRPKPTHAVSIPLKVAQPMLKAEYASGESFTDSNGCVGGSLRKHTEEGESRMEHEKHIARYTPAPQSSQNSLPRRATGLTAQDLRRAVIMAEILDRPKALRRPGSRI